jgi:hypothetical protein
MAENKQSNNYNQTSNLNKMMKTPTQYIKVLSCSLIGLSACKKISFGGSPFLNSTFILKQTLLILLFITISQPLRAQNSVLDLGARLQKDIGLYSENGISINYSDKNLKPDRWYFGFSYFTSRLGTALNSNAIKQDNFLLSTSYYFKQNHALRPFVRLNAGYFSANYGSPIFDVLPSKTYLLAPEVGLSYKTTLPLKVALSFGYNTNTSNGTNGVPGTIYPFYYQLTLSWNILKQ